MSSGELRSKEEGQAADTAHGAGESPTHPAQRKTPDAKGNPEWNSTRVNVENGQS